MEGVLDPVHDQPTGLCEDASGEASALIQRMAHGDGAALVSLHGMWGPVLLGIAYRMLGDRREAEEVTKETFGQLWKRAAGFDPHESPPFVWAFVHMRRFALNRLQRRKGRKDAAGGWTAASHERGDELKVMTADDSRRLRSAINQLDLEERTCLDQAVFLGYARPEIPSAAVKNHLRKALQSLRNQLSCHEL